MKKIKKDEEEREEQEEDEEQEEEEKGGVIFAGRHCFVTLVMYSVRLSEIRTKSHETLVWKEATRQVHCVGIHTMSPKDNLRCIPIQCSSWVPSFLAEQGQGRLGNCHIPFVTCNV